MKTINFICFILFPVLSYGQLITYQASAQSLINSSFLGQNYIVSNVQYIGDSLAKGQFNGELTNLGLTEGIVLTTGTAMDTTTGPWSVSVGPHGPNNNGSAGLDNGAYGYQPLTILAGEQTMNAAVLEFDFIPLIDSISLNYVFGSEEYPEFVNAGYNDVFAILLSGPGIVDTINIALLPDGTPVTIDNVNNSQACVNSAYYVENGNGSENPYDSLDTYIQYDGFTISLSASKGGLLIGETYHLIIAISDVGDGAYDSGLFIEKCADCSYAVGINNNDLELGMSIYPNPSKGLLNIEMNNTPSGDILIFDTVGRLVIKNEVTEISTVLDVQNLQKGIYIVVFTDGKNIVKAKLIIQ
jgi:hypothetical protein